MVEIQRGPGNLSDVQNEVGDYQAQILRALKEAGVQVPESGPDADKFKESLGGAVKIVTEKMEEHRSYAEDLRRRTEASIANDRAKNAKVIASVGAAQFPNLDSAQQVELQLQLEEIFSGRK